VLRRPVDVVPDPIRGGDSVLVLCMVMNPDGSPHETNYRQALMDILDDEILAQEPLYGFEQACSLLLACLLPLLRVPADAHPPAASTCALPNCSCRRAHASEQELAKRRCGVSFC
jgi:hypothetical protein